MTKLALIIDKSKSYVDFQKKRVFENWGQELSESQTISNINDSGAVTLFGDTPVSVLHLDENTDVKKLVDDFTKRLEKTSIEDIVSTGVVITTHVPRTSTKKLEKLVKDVGGELYIAANSGKGNVTENIVSELNLNHESKQFLISYIGDDYENAIPIVNTVSKLAKNLQAKITIEDLMIRLPLPPGSIPPWEIEKPLYSGDMSEVIRVYRRVAQNTHYLVILAILKNKFQLAYRISALHHVNPSTTLSDLSENLNVANNYPLKLAFGNAKKYKTEKLKKIIEEIVDTEYKVKGNSAADGSVLMELLLVSINTILKG